MVYNQTMSIWDLPPQPLLPIDDIKDAVFVTIWLVACLAFAGYLRALLNRDKNATWQEFRTVKNGTLCLAVWYVTVIADRWMRYSLTAVMYGYLLVGPVFEALRVASTILLLWGTYTVVWKELEDQFSIWQQGVWWFAAKLLVFVVSLMAIFYVVLDIALSVVWLEFFSLNSIADIAGKRTDFEMAMTAFFFLFGLLTLVEATVAWAYAFKIHGQVQGTRLYLWLTTLFLFARSTSELIIVSQVYKTTATRQGTKLATDVSYGFLTFLYLVMVCWMASVAASTFDRGGREARMVASDVRRYVLQKLYTSTNGTREQAPPFETVIRDAERNLETMLSKGPFSRTLDLKYEYKQNAALEYIGQLRAEFGSLGVGEGDNHNSRPAFWSALSAFASMLASCLRSKSAYKLNMSSNTPPRPPPKDRRPAPSNTMAATRSTPLIPTTPPEEPIGYGPTPSLYSSVPSAIPLASTPRPTDHGPIRGASTTANSIASTRRPPFASGALQVQSGEYQARDSYPRPFEDHWQSLSPSPRPPPVARRPFNGSASSPPAPQHNPPPQDEQPVPTSPTYLDNMEDIGGPSQLPVPQVNTEVNGPAQVSASAYIPISQPVRPTPLNPIRTRQLMQNILQNNTPNHISQSPTMPASIASAPRRPTFQRRLPIPEVSSTNHNNLSSPSATPGSSYQQLKAQRDARVAAERINGYEVEGRYRYGELGLNPASVDDPYPHSHATSPTTAPTAPVMTSAVAPVPFSVPNPIVPLPTQADYSVPADHSLAFSTSGPVEAQGLQRRLFGRAGRQ